MGNENDEPNSAEVFRPRTAADLIQEAARVVNWRPDEKHPQQARYDAALALSSLYAYWTTVALETLRRLDPAAAERVTSHIDDDLGWADAHEHAYGWEQALDAGKPIPSDAWPFWEILGRPDTQPAGEHHTGSLDLTGQGNAPASPQVIYWCPTAREIETQPGGGFDVCCRAPELHEPILAIVYAAIRQQVAEEITREQADVRARIIADLTTRRAEITEGRPGWVYLTEAIGIAKRGLL